ncbi:acyl-peptide hydrolase [Steroidobacter agaridevorans]|uniref:Acyl-peptide hydrolase n=1 Tax=Steroidobacter agaridevorans TaxID=2695856 RepID=A0A829YFR5_9GAMM|nr:S9 family peptidase [Steroidobacter agaridevorans]GFE81678.1 acyl-peptide hydrolase [Steroidobacter agaridevorans]GFE90422.1 acyl-peptide hydrolase [Steroidobacter agaridevorans]
MQLRLLVALLATATPLTAALADPPAAPNKIFQGRDLFDLQYATDPQIRPDGRAVAYARRSFDIMTDRGRSSIWLVDTETGAQAPVVAGAGSHGSPRWSPKGDRLAYVSSAEDGRPQLFVRWMQTGQTAKLAELLDAPDSLTWSPDGKWIAFTMFAPDDKKPLGEAPPKPENAQWAPPLEVITDITYRADGAGYLKPGYTHVYVIAADGGTPRQLTFGAFNESGPLTWAPDGSYIVATGNRNENWRREPVNTELYRIALSDGQITPLTQRAGPDGSARVSPDGKTIAYLSFDDKFMGYQNVELHVMNADGGNQRSLTASLDRSIDDVQWAPNGRDLYIRYDDHAVTKVARVALNGKVTPVAQGLSGASLDRPYTGGDFTIANDGTIAFTSGSGARPSDVSISRGGRSKQLTNLNEGSLGGKTLGQVQHLDVKSSFDQRPVDAWLVLPPNFDRNKKYPLILEIHGGPFAAYAPLFSTDYQLYAAAGYVVLYTNPRGSTSYGDEFANLIHHKYPGNDYDDLISSVDAAIAQGFVDPDNLFVTGGSGGGVLTAWIVGKTHRFKAAASQKPVINWTSLVLTTDGTAFMTKYWFGKTPWEDPETYWARSPLSLVGSVKTPTLVVVGDQDFRTPLSDSEQYYQALQLAGVPTGLVKVPGASHGGFTSRPSQSAAKASAILAWFERYRGK